MSPLYKRGTWYWLRYRDARGVLRRVPLRTKNKDLARQLAAEKEVAAIRERLGLDNWKPKPMTYNELADQYVAATKGRASAKDIKGRTDNYLRPAFGPKDIRDITPAEVETLLAGLEDKRSPQLREHLRALLRAQFNFAIDRLKVMRGENPAAAAPRVKVPKQKGRVVPPHIVAAILAAIDDEYRPLVATAVYTGLRRSELLRMLVTDVDLAGGFLRVSPDNKDAEERFIPIHPDLVPYLKVELGRARSELLFPGPDGKPRRKDWKSAALVRRAIRSAGIAIGYDHWCRRCGSKPERRADDAPGNCRRCGMKLWVRGVPPHYTFRDLRSTFGSTVLRATGGDLVSVQRLLGHSDPKVTERHYLGADVDRLREQVAKLSFPEHKKSTTADAQEAAPAEVIRIQEGKQ